MRLTVFGPTGATGRLLVARALAAGHRVTAYARAPGKLAAADDLVVVEGQLDDGDAIRRAVVGADAVISLLGPGRNKADIAPLVPGTRAIVGAMSDAGVRRLVATATPSAPDPEDGRDLRLRAMVTGVRYGMPAAYGAIRGLADVIRASTLDWTIVRLPLLHDGAPSTPPRARRVGERGGLRLSRAGLADFLLHEVTDRQWVHRSPLVADT